MINVKVDKDNGIIKSIIVKGHSGYEDAGKDIVCSSVSTMVILTINLLQKLNIDFDYQEDEKVPMMSLNINQINSEEQKLVQTILENLVENLEMVSKQYKKFLKIN